MKNFYNAQILRVVDFSKVTDETTARLEIIKAVKDGIIKPIKEIYIRQGVCKNGKRND